MRATKTAKTLGTEKIRWDLSCFYKSIDDPQIDADVAAWEKTAQQFEKRFKGKLNRQLGGAIRAYAKLSELENKIFVYLHLMCSLDQTNETAKTKMDVCGKKLTIAASNHLTFFEHEITRLNEKDIAKQTRKNKVVAFHMPWIEETRKQKPYLLAEEIEQAISKRSSFGPGSWNTFYDEMEAQLQFPFEGKQLTQNEILHIAYRDKKTERRAHALAVFNETLGKQFAPLSAQTLNIIVGAKQLEDTERGYPHPMSARNLNNKIPDDAEEALHETVLKIGAPLAQRYYKLKSKHLGISPLAWSDRMAATPFESRELIPYPEALNIVLKAYQSFSETLYLIVKSMVEQKRIDVHASAGRNPGAFNAPCVLPNNTPACFTFMNYLGTTRDVMTLAHELGHGVHGILAGETQGVLLQRAPTALAETASIFGEITTFNFLKQRIARDGNTETLIALNMGKLDDIINTVVRQISLSFFERRVHAIKNRLSVSELNKIWIKVTKEFYGDEGVIFNYKNCEYLWSYIPHFHSPFYVYGYAFGQLLTQSLYAIQSRFETKEFETLYLDLLRAGGSKSPVELLKPFGLDPTSPQFWREGLRTVETLLAETERLSAECGIK